MKIQYITGEEAIVGDVVILNDDEPGRVTVVGDDLIDWGLSKEELKDGKIMIDFDNMGLVCQIACDEELKFVRRQ